MATAVKLSPPLKSAQVGCRPLPRAEISQRLAVSHSDPRLV